MAVTQNLLQPHDDWYAETSHAAFHLLILWLMNEPLYTVRHALFEHTKETIFASTPLYDLKLYTRVNDIDLIHSQLSQSFDELRRLNVELKSPRQKATAIYRLWLDGFINKGMASLHLNDDEMMNLFVSRHYSSDNVNRSRSPRESNYRIDLLRFESSRCSNEKTKKDRLNKVIRNSINPISISLKKTKFLGGKRHGSENSVQWLSQNKRPCSFELLSTVVGNSENEPEE